MSDIVRRKPFLNSPGRSRIIGFGCAFAAAALVVAFAPAWTDGLAKAVAAYDAAAFTLIVIFWTLAMHAHPQDTEARAAVEDPGRNVVLSLVFVTIAGAFASAINIIGHGPRVTDPNEKAIVYALGLGAVVLGWFLIHTLLTFRYAHMYYFDDDGDNEADRGLKFPGTGSPNDFDFAYFSFVIGMTFQVSDVEITDAGVRRYVLYHALISFAYNTAILALVVNLGSNLIGH
jgi:uncharacterized membrane protein